MTVSSGFSWPRPSQTEPSFPAARSAYKAEEVGLSDSSHMWKSQTLLDCGSFRIWLRVKELDPNPVTTLIIYQRAHVWSSSLRAKPSSRQWLNWPFRVLDQTLSSVMQEELLYHCRAVGANTRQEQPLLLSWSCWHWAEPASAVIFCRSLISQFTSRSEKLEKRFASGQTKTEIFKNFQQTKEP